MSRAKDREATRRQRMSTIDSLPAEIRGLVHNYGYNTVRAFLDCGVRSPKHIRHLVETVLNEFSPTRGSNSKQAPTMPGPR